MNKIISLFSFPLQADKRIYGLDLMRAIAILLVLVSHGRIFLRPLYPWVDYFKIGGFLGVELFFVLSGFLIGGILIKMINAEKEFTFHSVKNFWIRRWFRTLPNYYLVLLINVLLSVFLFYDFNKQYLSFIFFLQNFSSPHPKIFEEAWSLSVEEWFYLLLPVCILLLSVVGRKILSGKQIILMASLLFIIIILALRIQFVIRYNPQWANGIRKVVMFRLDTVIWGVLAAWFSFYFPEKWRKVRSVTLVFSILLFIIVAYFYYTDVQSGEASFFAKTFYFSLVSIAGMLLLPFLSAMKISGNISSIRYFFTYTSIISYSLYLVHLSVAAKLIFYFVPFSPRIWSVAFVAFFIIAYLMSALLYKFFEKPVMELREKLS